MSERFDYDGLLEVNQALRDEVARLTSEIKSRIWLLHGSRLGHNLYGDDGEMQCIECHPYGATDYKRDPLDKVEHATFRARMAHAAQIEEGE